jgi:hypothetical protein
MNTIKFISDKKIKLNNTKYKPYTVGNLPPSFGIKYTEDSDGKVKEGMSHWFNYKGFTYVEDKESVFVHF